MAGTDTWTRDELFAYVQEQYGQDALDTRNLIERWLTRGDGVAVYENAELGHPELGHCKIVSYGSAVAQLEPQQLNSEGMPPQTLPDGIPAGEINWRYQLKAVCRG
jgi:hypothetical protein